VHAVQGRRRADGAGPVPGASSRRGLPVGQDRSGRPHPMRWTPPPARSPAGSRVTGWTCWTRTGKRRSLSRSAPAVSPPSSPTVRRDQQLSGRAASVARSLDAASRGCRAGRAQAAPHPPAGAATTAPGHAHPAHQCQHRLRAGLAGPDRYQASTDAWITSLTWTTTWTGCPPDPYRTALVAAWLSARTMSSAASLATPQARARGAPQPGETGRGGRHRQFHGHTFRTPPPAAAAPASHARPSRPARTARPPASPVLHTACSRSAYVASNRLCLPMRNHTLPAPADRLSTGRRRPAQNRAGTLPA
jgi:hypothetical protein